MDEQRLKARQAKAGLNPGPGAYDVKRAIVTASEVRQPNSAVWGGLDERTEGTQAGWRLGRAVVASACRALPLADGRVQ